MLAATQQPPAVNNKALAWTVGVHILLLLLFFLFQYTIPVITNDIGSGLEVNLGTSADGSGTDQPQNKEDPSAYSASVVYNTAASKSSLPKDMLQSNDATDPSVNNPDKTKNNPGASATKDKDHPVQKPKFVYEGTNGKGGNGAQQNTPGTNEGNGNGPGDKGVPGGTPGAGNYTGTPGSGGIGHTLTGRKISPERFEAEFREGGKVVIHVTVDRDGNIVSKFVKSSSSQQLTKLALEKLGNAKFSKSTGPEPQQFGDVTIVFKAR